MMKMSSNRSERSSEFGGKGNHGGRILPAALAEPTTPTVGTARGTTGAWRSIDATSIGTTVKVMVKLTNGKVYTHVIARIIQLCDFPEDSIMVRYIDQKGWMELEEVTMIGVHEVKDFFTVRDDGIFETNPMLIHFIAFLLYFKRKGQELLTTLKEDDILDMKNTEFKKYCGSADYHADIATFDSPVMTVTSPRIDANTDEVVDTTNLTTVQEFQESVKRDDSLYGDLEDDKKFIKLDHELVATAQMLHTDYVLDVTHGSIS
jgi:hypothetical protein